ncbi:hydroxymethylglutaryl-CoA reductase, degradative [Candidatus Micrarchaeota archaeon]|nr:hydroxymethylglutaryl-CoA reductase, degradative [Candidatus Micrarchaeota archaeon]
MPNKRLILQNNSKEGEKQVPQEHRETQNESASPFEGFYKKSIAERIEILKNGCKLSEEDAKLLLKEGGLDLATADKMIENVVGTYALPFGIATNFVINGREVLIPMVLEEPSVVAAASNAAKLAKAGGGFATSSDNPVMIGQLQITDILAPETAEQKILWAKNDLLEKCNAQDAVLVKYGGGARDIITRIVKTHRGTDVVVHVLVDVRDAMGANAVNTMCEAIAPTLEDITGGRVCLRILSNLAVFRRARAKAVWTKETLEKSARVGTTGTQMVSAILDAYALAAADPFRAATHNKGIMNGIDAVVVATGNDWRAVEAGAQSGPEAEEVAARMSQEGRVRAERAKELLDDMRKGRRKQSAIEPLDERMPTD